MDTSNIDNVPLLTNSAGREDKDFNFEIDEEAGVSNSCSLTWKNELYVFGGDIGSETNTQISKVTSCRLETIAQLAFNHVYGDCVNVASNIIVLCFNSASTSGDERKCRMASSPTGDFSVMTPSRYDHKYTRIATNDGEFIKQSLILTFLLQN